MFLGSQNVICDLAVEMAAPVPVMKDRHVWTRPTWQVWPRASLSMTSRAPVHVDGGPPDR